MSALRGFCGLVADLSNRSRDQLSSMISRYSYFRCVCASITNYKMYVESSSEFYDSILVAMQFFLSCPCGKYRQGQSTVFGPGRRYIQFNKESQTERSCWTHGEPVQARLPRGTTMGPPNENLKKLFHLGSVSSSGLEDGVMRSEVGSGDETGAPDEAAGEVVDDGAVEVGQNDDVELPRVRHQLHAAAIQTTVKIL